MSTTGSATPPTTTSPVAPADERSEHGTARLRVPSPIGTSMIFFSNRMGCLGSILVSVVLTAVVVLVVMVL